MRSEERDFRRENRENRENRDYNENRYQDYGRERNRPEDRAYGYNMSGQRYDRRYDRGGFNRERDMYSRYEPNQEFNQGPIGIGGTDFDQDLNYNRYGGRGERGHFHSTETDQPGRAYSSEREMNRNGNLYRDEGPDRSYGQGNRSYTGERGYGRNRTYNEAHSHAATGDYEDFERDLDRFGMRRDYERGQEQPGRNRSGDYGRRGESRPYGYEQQDYGRRRDYTEGPVYGRERGSEYGRERGREENPSLYYRRQEDAEQRRRLSQRIQDRGLERSPSGNWGPSDYSYREEYQRSRGDYF